MLVSRLLSGRATSHKTFAKKRTIRGTNEKHRPHTKAGKEVIYLWSFVQCTFFSRDWILERLQMDTKMCPNLSAAATRWVNGRISSRLMVILPFRPFSTPIVTVGKLVCPFCWPCTLWMKTAAVDWALGEERLNWISVYHIEILKIDIMVISILHVRSTCRNRCIHMLTSDCFQSTFTACGMTSDRNRLIYFKVH